MRKVKIIITCLLLGIVTLSWAQNTVRKKANITASYSIPINAPIDTVWKFLAEDYGGIGQWASGVNHVIESSGSGITAERSCEISAAGFNDTKEKVILFQPEKYYFEYDLYEGLPGFVDYSINKDQLSEKDGQTIWTSYNEMRVKGVMSLMKGIMRKKLEDVLAAKAVELKHFIETGRPHPNKLAALAKLEKRQLFVLTEEITASPNQVWKVLADEFASVSNSHPVSTSSTFTNGSTEVRVGSQRIMYMSKNKKKYFIDEIIRLNPEKGEMALNVVKAKGYPISFANVEFLTDPLSSHETRLTLIFTYQTKPKFLGKLAKKRLKSQLQDYLYAIHHHVKTQEIITQSNWKKIRKNYQ